MTDKTRKLRSSHWFNNPAQADQTALHLERYLNYGLTAQELQSGRPIIGIAQTGSDLAPCNRHHLELAQRTREGIRDAGGVPIEFPVHPIFESGRRPTAALDRNLTYLGLFQNGLTGSIPSSLGSLSNLYYLGLSSNGLTGSIPASLGSLSNLEYFRLDRNDLTGSIPSSLGNLTEVWNFELQDNNISGSIPSSFGNMSDLEILILQGNELAGQIPTSIGNLSKLGVTPLQLNAVFITHMHSDHIEDLAGILQYRWHFLGKPLDVICSADVSASKPPPGRTMSCAGYLAHSGDAFLASGEIAQRSIENKKRNPAGPATTANLKAVSLPLPEQPGTVVWEQGDVSVQAIASKHIPGHLF